MKIGNQLKKSAAVSAAFLGLLASAGLANAADSPAGVNVALGPDVVLTNVKVAHAARIAANACGTTVGVQAAINQVELLGATDQLCTTAFGIVTIADVDEVPEATGTLPPAFASNLTASTPTTPSADGRFNVTLGEVTLRQLNVALAATVAAYACNTRVGPQANRIAKARRLGTMTLCTLGYGAVTATSTTPSSPATRPSDTRPSKNAAGNGRPA